MNKRLVAALCAVAAIGWASAATAQDHRRGDRDRGRAEQNGGEERRAERHRGRDEARQAPPQQPQAQYGQRGGHWAGGGDRPRIEGGQRPRVAEGQGGDRRREGWRG
ncbi:MAG: hypothetical protein HXY28_03785, partial [Hydrogenophilaceae bacterium]|nr:hypothetical protein [Hydrogenophilaceae bacterium]